MQPGEIISERFVLEEIAGQGGMGTVFRALDTSTKQIVALKALTRISDDGLQRFQREVQILSSLSHPGIVGYIAHGFVERTPYLAMEWLEGESLDERLSRAPLGGAEALLVATKIADALGAAHASGIIHRDIKPSNIFLVERRLSQVKILDFGIARQAAEQADVTKVGQLVGSPGYLSPEQARGNKQLTPAADIFSLGVVLFECLTGQLPFQAQHTVAVLVKILFEEAPRLRSLKPLMPAALDELVARMLAKEAAGRFGSGLEAAAALRSCEAFDEEVTSFTPIQRSSFTEREQRLLGVLLLSGVFEASREETVAQTVVEEGGPGAFEEPALQRYLDDSSNALAERLVQLRAHADSFGGVAEPLVDGSLVVTFMGDGEAIDQAIRSARCSLAFRKLLPSSSVALALGRGTVKPWPLGEVIDRAAQLLQQGAKLFIDDTTAALLRQRFEIEQRPEGNVLLDERAEETVARTLLGRESVFVGRRAELNLLRTIYSQCINEEAAKVVVLTAPAGTGKSRLRYEFLRQARGLILFGKGDPISAGSPFLMISQAIQAVARIQREDTPQKKHQRIRDLVNRLTETSPMIEAYPKGLRVSEFLGELANAPTQNKPSLPLMAARQDPQLMGDQLQRAFVDWLRGECSAQPVLFVLEDLHWGDAATISLLSYALRELRDTPLFVFALGRPALRERFAGLWQDAEPHQIVLRELAPDACSELIKQALGERPPELVTRLIEQSQGNAFYLEELIRAVSEGREEALPETVLAMAQARLERLPERARQLLRAASLFGGDFSRELLQRLLRGVVGGEELQRLLQQLVQQEVLLSSEEGSYRFRHSLMREAAYATMPAQDRAAGHRLVALHLETAEQDALLIATHWLRADEPANAGPWFSLAANEALRGHDLQSAVELAEQALRCGLPEEQAAPLQILQLEALGWLGRTDEVQERLPKILTSCPQGGGLWYKATVVQFVTSLHTGDISTIFETSSLLQSARPAEDAGSFAEMAASLVVSFGSIAGLYSMAKEMLSNIRQRPPLPDTADGALGMGWRYHAYGYDAFYIEGSPWEYLELSLVSRQHFERAGAIRGVLTQVVELGRAYLSLGALEEAEEILRDGLSQVNRSQNQFLRPRMKLALGQCMRRKRRLDEGRALLEEAARGFEQNHDRTMQGNTRAELGRLLLEANELATAEEVIEASLEALAFVAPLRSRALAVKAMLCLAKQDLQGATDVNEEAMSLFESLGNKGFEESYLRMSQVETLLATQDPRAKDTLREAKARLMSRAKTIPSATYRRSFLAGVEENRRVLALAEQHWIE